MQEVRVYSHGGPITDCIEIVMLPPEQLEQLAGMCTTAVYKVGIALFDHPTKCDALHMVVAGKVQVTPPQSWGGEPHVVEAGGYMGELCCLKKVDWSLGRAEVTERAVIISLTAYAVEKVLDQDPVVKRRVAALLARRGSFLRDEVYSVSPHVTGAPRRKRRSRTRKVPRRAAMWGPAGRGQGILSLPSRDCCPPQ
eukprot:1402332-Pyramimonas_sp.AAC.1